MFDDPAKHWLLLQVDLRERCFYVYDSLPAAKKQDSQRRQQLVNCAVNILPARPLYMMHHAFCPVTSSLLCLQKIVVGLSLMRGEHLGDVLTWEVMGADCPRQQK